MNNAINFLKKERRNLTRPLEFVEQKLGDKSTDPVAMTRQKMMKERINQAMGKLPKEFRIILSLKVEKDLSYDEISKVLKVPRGTVMSRLARARQKLRKTFEEMEVR